MIQEEKELLIKDLCARLPYGIKADGYPWITREYVESISRDRVNLQGTWVNIEDVKPYLRPMSSMTEDEVKEFATLESIDVLGGDIKITCVELSIDAIDWLNANHFDYRGLIPMGFALEAKEGMYK